MDKKFYFDKSGTLQPRKLRTFTSMTPKLGNDLKSLVGTNGEFIDAIAKCYEDVLVFGTGILEFTENKVVAVDPYDTMRMYMTTYVFPDPPATDAYGNILVDQIGDSKSISYNELDILEDDGGLVLPWEDYAHSVRIAEANSVPYKEECSHDFKEYVGFTERFHYCVHCDIKKT